MPNLITIGDVKTRFPRWLQFIRIDATDDTPALDARLTQIVDDAESELLEYVTVSQADMNAQLTRHLMNIVRKGCFDVKNAEVVFESKPQIVRDYENTLRRLRDYQAGLLATPGKEQKSFVVTAKPRLFKGKWLHPED